LSKELDLSFFQWRYHEVVSPLITAASPLTELADLIGGGIDTWWRFLYASNNNTSTSF
jgi:hypothetical protein